MIMWIVDPFVKMNIVVLLVLNITAGANQMFNIFNCSAAIICGHSIE